MSEALKYYYFTDPADGSVWAYDEAQIESGYGEGMKPLTGKKLDEVLNPKPTPEQVSARNESEQVFRIDEASKIMAPLLVSLQLGDATEDETSKAKSWRSYYRALKAVDLTVQSPDWPNKPDV